MTHQLPPMRDVKFGFAAAETEAARNPELLLQGFVDPQGYIDELINNDRYLILGPKGSGKSALVQHLRLRNANDPDYRFDVINLPELSWADIARIKTGETSDSTRVSGAWRFLLLLHIYQYITNAPGMRFASDKEAQVLLSALTNAGLLTQSINDVVDLTSKTTIKVKLGIAGVDHERSESSVHLRLVAGEMLRILRNLQNESELTRLIFALDGLDALVLQGSKQWTSIAGLVATLHGMNQHFLNTGTPVRIWLLSRHSVYDRLHYAESNKIKHDWGISIRWDKPAENGTDSWLFDLVDKKASASLDVPVNVLNDYFPPRVNFAKIKGTPRTTRELLLSYTRYTPRDVLMLTRCIAQASNRRVNDKSIRAGLYRYCTEYFVAEVRNELVAVTEDDHLARTVLEAMSGLESKFFRLETLFNLVRRVRGTLDEGAITDCVKQLYDIGAIGIVQSFQRGTLKHYVFTYKGDQVPFQPTAEFLLHNGLIRAFSLPFGSTPFVD